MSVYALPFIVAKNHSLGLSILICRDVSDFLMLVGIYNLFLTFVFLNWITANLKFVVGKSSFVLSGVLVFRNNRVEIKNIFVWRLQLSKNIICNVRIVCACCVLIWTVLWLFSFSTRRQLQLIYQIFSHIPLRIYYLLRIGLRQQLILMILGVGMLGEVFLIFAFNY